ncbi:DEAD/DEAH box helicase [Gloeocapsa sp. PCC 73106]|uniref:DEAD/DEAH box helicase n=1 Tax=Gloeocapsa sp. PCC 73106 TaxID=102232 RepID=UPI0002ABDF94|nr:DEAD/DEAH box helicase [Gloeocapsa sp. PCC 73106]ELR98522.1 DNA/RNA helicase, superfamily II, SNF2 family [Gloeocapsa sp. PCC 73106]
MVKNKISPAPGARVVIRDAEWLIQSVDRTNSGAKILRVVGISDFIKGKSANFVEELEADLEVLDPKTTTLVGDDSQGFRRSLLFIEAHLRQTAPTTPQLYVGQKAALDLLPFQLDPALIALKMPRQRILIADSVGLGKTLESGILVSELIRRGKGKRMLVVTTKSMLTQFQKEYWFRFTIPLVRLDSVGIQRLRNRIPTNHNPFHYFDKAIVSVDTLKQDRSYRTYLEQAYWDIIVIDECHNVARRGSASLRSKLAERLATRSDTLIMLSATPHDGRPESFASLMKMLDPTAIASESDYTKEDIRGLYVRRFKKDVKDQLAKNFPERQVIPVEAQASILEEAAFTLLDNLKLTGIDRQAQTGKLFKTTLLKAMFSSPMACLETVNHRLKKAEHPSDIAELMELGSALEQITPSNFTKYQKLLELIKSNQSDGFGWKGNDSKDRLVIFTERLETMRFLRENLQRDLNLKPTAITTLEGSMADIELNSSIEQFGEEKSPLRLLIATDVASEGINLHFLSYRLIHFDIPWSLMVLQQRNGRIDRYGQEQQPQIRYLLTRSLNPRVDEAERIIRVLIAKDEQAIKNIGDPSVFMGVFDIDEEVRITAKAIEAGESAESFDAMLTPPDNEFDFFSFLEQQPEITQDFLAEMAQMPSLFRDDFEYTLASLEAINQNTPLQYQIYQEQSLIELTFPSDLKRRYERLPREIQPPPQAPLRLCADKTLVKKDLEESRKAEERWTPLQYLWELHPAVQWFNDFNLTTFRRHQAPVIILPSLAPEEAVFVMTGLIPNRRGQPLLNQWFSVVFNNYQFTRVESFATTLERTKLGENPIPNPGVVIEEKLLELRDIAVERAYQEMLTSAIAFETELNQALQLQLDRLTQLRQQHNQQLELRFTNDHPLVKERREREKRYIDSIFDDYWRWVEDSMTTEPVPYIKVISVLRGKLT